LSHFDHDVVSGASSSVSSSGPRPSRTPSGSANRNPSSAATREVLLEEAAPLAAGDVAVDVLPVEFALLVEEVVQYSRHLGVLPDQRADFLRGSYHYAPFAATA